MGAPSAIEPLWRFARKLGASDNAATERALATYVDFSLLPAPTPCYPMSSNSRLRRCVRWADILTADQAQEYARRFFRGAITHARRHRKGVPLFALWADAARLYVEAHSDAKSGVAIGDVRDTLAQADQKSATALEFERRGGGGSSPPKPTPSPPSQKPSDSSRPRPSPLPDGGVKQAGLSGWIVAAAAAGAGLLAYAALGRSDDVIEEERFEEEFF